MKRWLLWILGCVLFQGSVQAQAMPAHFYDVVMKDINGKTLEFNAFKGKVVLVVNVASKCGFTSQYEQLQKLYETYKDKGLIILGVPANNFFNQEPGSDTDIKSFCQLNYGVSFPLTSKVSVKGKDMASLYGWLTSKKTNPKFSGAIKWNFTKFIVGKNGEILNRFEPATKPNDPSVIQAIEQALRQ